VCLNGCEVLLLSWADPRWLALVIGTNERGRVMPIFPFPPAHLRPLRHKYGSPLPLPPPERCLVLRGGWEMNHTGLFHSFGRPVRPKRISLQLRVASSATRRSYLNVFFSTRPQPMANQRLFWAGNSHFPPNPPDLFTLLLATSDPPLVPATEPASDAMLWLPSGETHHVHQPLARKEW
jgi:hypothetical protein